MSKLIKIFAIAVLIAGTLAMTPRPAAAQHHGGGHWHGGGGWRGGGWRGGGWGWGPGPFWGWGYGYPYYGGPGCGYVRVWRHGYWVLRRPYRCS
jgi:hypothetical protein